MKNDMYVAEPYDDEIDLRELFSVLWSAKKKIIGITMVFAVFSVALALWLPNQYKATVVLAPAQQQSGGLASALGQVGGLASLAGLNIGSGESSDSQIAQEIMGSWSFIDKFIVENDLAVEVYAASRWREKQNELAIDDDIYDVASQEWLIEDDDTDELRPPTSWELYKEFVDRITISEDSKTGLVSVSIEYFSPYMAQAWVDLYVQAINSHMQSREVVKVSRNIEYLQNQISKTAITEMQEVFFVLVEEQIKAKMVAEASPDYAFVTVSPSMLPEEESQPKRALICILGTLLGGMLSVLLVLVMHYAKKSD
ncbi:Wzz/FepE/Etk N-terminal domain-containing protein [Porticoccaceae bacterium]|nr:Wzz/FepE/Etk N-terminal domain-containing protein [Porticoccaceae bacterium]